MLQIEGASFSFISVALSAGTTTTQPHADLTTQIQQLVDERIQQMLLTSQASDQPSVVAASTIIVAYTTGTSSLPWICTLVSDCVSLPVIHLSNP